MAIELSDGYIKSIKQMKKQGFTHFKVELEAQLNRNYDEDSHGECTYCSEGRISCQECSGSGEIEHEVEEATKTTDAVYEMVSCDDCENGLIECDECYGDWEATDYGDWSDEHCEAYLLDNVSEAAREAIVYSRFYNDGSVDSEFTFTVALDDAHLTIEYIEAFNLLAGRIDGGMDTEGAGMHLTMLTGSNYPQGQKTFNPDKINNFQREVTKLLPALYFVASPDHKSRDLYYRPPKIEWDKYSAIHIMEGCLEYRIFETCYQRPTAILDDIEVIAKTLVFYSDKRVNIAPPKQNLRLGDGGGVSRFYNNEEALRLLNRGLAFIRPADKTITQLKRERSFKVTPASCKKKLAQAVMNYAGDYETYKNRWERDAENQVDQWLRFLQSPESYFNPNDPNVAHIMKAHAKGSRDELKKALLKSHIDKLESRDEYVERRANNENGRYVLDFSR